MGEMSMVETLHLWNEAVSLTEKGNFQDALMQFMKLEERKDPDQAMITSARNMFNIGQTYLSLGRMDMAVQAFEKSLEKDGMLAVSHFMLGCTNLRQNKSGAALKSFDNAYFFLRGNRLIDYKQLGLKYKLCGCEILCNRAICHGRLGNDQQARNDFLKAMESKVDPRHAAIEDVLLCWQTGTYMQPIELPSHAVFQPSKKKLQTSNKKQDFTGQSVVIASEVVNGKPKNMTVRSELLKDLRKKETRKSLKKRQPVPTRGPDSAPPPRPLPNLPRRDSPNTPPARPVSPHPKPRRPDSPVTPWTELGKPPTKPLPPMPQGKGPIPRPRSPIPVRAASPQLAARLEEGEVIFQLVVTRNVKVNKNSSVQELSRAAAKALDVPENDFTLWYTRNNELTSVTDQELETLWKLAPHSKPTVFCYESKP